MGTEGPSNDTGSFGDISLNLGGHEEVASFFNRCFPKLPTPESFQENAPPHFAWFDASGSEHSNSDRCDISGTELKPGDIDPNRTGRAVYCDQLRKTIFGQVEPIKTMGSTAFLTSIEMHSISALRLGKQPDLIDLLHLKRCESRLS
jgi:hypothetical protein